MAPDDEAEPTTRDARFIKTAVEILGETGRTDFTVQEVVARSKTSLRAFYQHFSSKDELLYALLKRAMNLYNQHLAETRPRDYARVLSPLHELIRDVVQRGITEGVFRANLDVGPAAAIVMQTILGALRLHWLGAELTGAPIDAAHLYDFCVRALGADENVQPETPSLAELFNQIGMRPGARNGE